MSKVERELIYRHSYDCLQSGCPSHTAKMIYYSVSDMYTITLEGQKEMTFDSNELEVIIDLLRIMNRADTIKITQNNN